MRQASAIARREGGAFFHSAMAPVVVTAFLLLTGLFFTFFAYGYSELTLSAMTAGRQDPTLNVADRIFQPLVLDMAIFLLFLLPAVSMRLFSEEYRSGRYDLIMTYPVTDATWVLGKFLSVLAVGASLLLAAGALFAAGGLFGPLEPGPLLAATVGLLLVTAAIGAWGVFFSALVSYQVVSYILTFAATLFVFVVGGLEPHLPPALARAALGVSLTEHFPRFTRGLIDSRDVFYFAAATALGLAAATAALAGRRLAGGRRALRWTPVAVLVVLIGVLGVIVGLHPLSADLTSNRRYSPAPQTTQVLRDLGADVQVHAFYGRLDPRRQPVATLLAAFRDRSPRFHYELIDPTREAGKVREYGVTVDHTVVVESQGRRRSLLDPDEGALINAVYRVVTGTQPVVYYLAGHGEHRLDSDDRGGYSALARLLGEQGYDLRALVFGGHPQVPADGAILVIAAPKQDLAPEEIEAVQQFVRGGGSVLALLDAGSPPAVSAWARGYGIILGDDVVVTTPEASAQLGFDPRVAVIVDTYGEHPITRGLEGLATFYPFAQSLSSAGEPPRGLEAAAFLRTGDRSWAEPVAEAASAGRPSFHEGVDRAGPLTLGVAVEVDRDRYFGVPAVSEAPRQPQPPPSTDPIQRALRQAQQAPARDATSVFDRGSTSRLVLIGDSDFAGNANLGLYGNRDLLLNALSWLAREQVLVSLRARGQLGKPAVLTNAQKDLVGWGCIVAWPLLAGAASLMLVLRRRRAR